MKRIATIVIIMAIAGTGGFRELYAQDSRPELMYFRFDEAGQLVTANKANPGTRVTLNATIGGTATMGSAGQFGSALVGSGSGSSSMLNTGWSTNLGMNSWTLSVWINNMPLSTTLNYIFGDASAGSFRCFSGGVAGSGNIWLRGPFVDIKINGVAPGPTVVHFVCDRSTNQIHTYKNGVFVASTTVSSTFNLTGSGGQFKVGGYATNPMLAGTRLDEFRLYNRVLTAQEIAATWNTDVDCFIPGNQIAWELLDAAGSPLQYAYTPGEMQLKYSVSYPEQSAPVVITGNLFDTKTNALKYSFTLNDVKPAGMPLHNTQPVSIPSSVPPGIYRVELVFNTMNSCGAMVDYKAGETALYVLEPGTGICLVWPGDNNNDGHVNFGDRKALANYIHQADTRVEWLTGPSRYRTDAKGNPLAYMKWEAQASIPWKTSDGCYMDSDGNGLINNFDYIAVKMNWMRTHNDPSKKFNGSPMDVGFDLSANFPNPFNPSTNLTLTLPERSNVRVTVIDMLGREVAILKDGIAEAGIYPLRFDAGQLQSGTYIATSTIAGIETGTQFTRSVRMNLAK